MSTATQLYYTVVHLKMKHIGRNYTAATHNFVKMLAVFCILTRKSIPPEQDVIIS
jgi:hypothetical protein